MIPASSVVCGARLTRGRGRHRNVFGAVHKRHCRQHPTSAVTNRTENGVSGSVRSSTGRFASPSLSPEGLVGWGA